MRHFWDIAMSKLRRDRGLSWRQLFDKSVLYASSTIAAPFYLRHANRVGLRVRTLGGGPRIINYGYLSIGDDTRISSHVVVVELCTAQGAELRIGNGVHINYGVSLGATKSIRIGDRVRLGPYTRVVDSDFHDVYDRAQPAVPKPVVIDDDAWLGMHVIVLPGVHIGKGAVVGSGSVVTKDVPDFAVVGGVPAKVLRELDPTRFVPDRTSEVQRLPPASRPN
jgi:carbonic anhydrase/acetyltransferase-like protein (isoleucine patch superfamily)